MIMPRARSSYESWCLEHSLHFDLSSVHQHKCICCSRLDIPLCLLLLILLETLRAASICQIQTYHSMFYILQIFLMIFLKEIIYRKVRFGEQSR